MKTNEPPPLTRSHSGHSAASRLLRAAVPLPTISAVLGHADPESTNVYLSVDHERLLDCVLPVPAGARS